MNSSQLLGLVNLFGNLANSKKIATIAPSSNGNADNGTGGFEELEQRVFNLESIRNSTKLPEVFVSPTDGIFRGLNDFEAKGYSNIQEMPVSSSYKTIDVTGHAVTTYTTSGENGGTHEIRARMVSDYGFNKGLTSISDIIGQKVMVFDNTIGDAKVVIEFSSEFDLINFLNGMAFGRCSSFVPVNLRAIALEYASISYRSSTTYSTALHSGITLTRLSRNTISFDVSRLRVSARHNVGVNVKLGIGSRYVGKTFDLSYDDAFISANFKNIKSMSVLKRSDGINNNELFDASKVSERLK